MSHKRAVKPPELPINEPAIDIADIWDPTGNRFPPEAPPTEDHNAHVLDWRQQLDHAAASPTADRDDEEADLSEFIASVRAVAGPDTEIKTSDSWSK